MKKEKKFKPKPGQVDFTDIRYAPVINCVLEYKGKVLLLQRSAHLRFHPGVWNGISGFLDDHKSLQEKVMEELGEEVGLSKKDVSEISLGQIFSIEDKKYKKTWITHPVLVRVKTDKIKLDWEAQNHQWIQPKYVLELKLMPCFDQVLRALKLVK